MGPRSIVLLERRVAGVACQPQLHGELLELLSVASVACVVRIVGGGLGFLVEECVLFPQAWVSESAG